MRVGRGGPLSEPLDRMNRLASCRPGGAQRSGFTASNEEFTHKDQISASLVTVGELLRRYPGRSAAQQLSCCFAGRPKCLNSGVQSLTWRKASSK
jgi:hypothetical protein